MLSNLQMFMNYATGLREFLRHRITVDDARAVVEGRLRNRERKFLEMLDRVIFGNSSSPYRALLRWAGIELGDVRRLVESDGLEGALHKLHAAGVFVSLAEFKGRKSIKRSGLHIPVGPQSFDNPFLKRHFEGRTGGSRGARRRLVLDLDLVAYDAAAHCLFTHSFGVSERPLALWITLPPNGTGVRRALFQAREGRSVERWFSQSLYEKGWDGWKYAAFLRYTSFAMARAGIRLPSPIHVPLDEAETIARWLAEQKRAGRTAQLDSLVGASARVCIAALDKGLDIGGTFFRVASEPMTQGRQDVFRRAGCRAGVHYGMAEMGTIGWSCPDAEAPDDVHMLDGKVALIQVEKEVSPGAPTVGAFHYTTLTPFAPKLMLNLECDDYGVVKKRPCSCLFGQAGLVRHIHTIRSYEKLTSEGVNFLGADLVTLVDEILPAKFGGHATYYQFLEEEDSSGVAKVSLVVSPRAGELDEDQLVQTVLQFIGRSNGNRLGTAFWAQARTLQVVRREPLATGPSKILPLHVLKSR